MIKKSICRTCLFRTNIGAGVCCGYLLFTGKCRGESETEDRGCARYIKTNRKERNRLIRHAKSGGVYTAFRDE